MSDSDSERDGFEAGAAGSQGDPRVLIAMNAILSTLFAWTIVWGLSFLGAVEFGLINVATAAVVLFAITYLVTMN
ncbi:hypothetical protein JMJ58_13450 [Haloterrigena salifodinae]|uniref:DUF8107 domain-containing protein n=1 Tax=Haloterrigena salifodinae TaxID=2675099 RepID=A0A8T8DXS0_9EURY|nr:hypothetical protein [Haloterrigena salifodinae]QRV13946.1 hypothetical protein JMJ58_13450 [Haloterrigena salifodinae]